MADSILPDVDWRDDGPYTWTKQEDLKLQLSKIQSELPWPDEYLTTPVRIDRLATLLKHIDHSPTIDDIQTYLLQTLRTWRDGRLKADLPLMFEVLPAFCNGAIFEFKVKPHPENDWCIVAADGTKSLTGTLVNWIVFRDGSGSALVARETERVAIEFNVHYLASHQECMIRVGVPKSAPNPEIETSVFVEPFERRTN